MDNRTPSLGKLFMNDRVIQNASTLTVAPILFQAVSYWGRGQFLQPLVTILTIVFVIGIGWLLYRYNVIMTTFRDGVTVRGRVTGIEKTVTRSKKGGRRTSYFARVSYAVQGESFEERLRLPGDPISYGISEGNDVDLILNEEKPKTVFIKHIYLD
jgi:hypothetical protein